MNVLTRADIWEIQNHANILHDMLTHALQSNEATLDDQRRLSLRRAQESAQGVIYEMATIEETDAGSLPSRSDAFEPEVRR